MLHFPKPPFPTWATNLNNPAGSDPWSGAPTKIIPDIAVRAAGLQPNDQIGAGQYNWLNHQYGALLGALAHSPMQDWKGFAPVEGDGSLSGYEQTIGVTNGAVIAPLYFSCTGALGVGEKLSKPGIIASDGVGGAVWSPSGEVWSPSCFSVLSGAHLDHFCGDIPDVVIGVGPSQRDVYRSTDAQQSFSIVANVADASCGFRSIFCTSTGRLLASIVGPSDINRIRYSDDAGLTWTSVAVPSATYVITQFAEGNGVIVAAFSQSPFAPGILYSTNNGTSWSLATEIPDGAGAAFAEPCVAWSPSWEQFMLLTGTFTPANNLVLTSANGVTWITRETPVYPQGDMACIGPAFCVGMQVTNPSGSPLVTFKGIAYTFDLGESWFFVPLGSPIDQVGGGGEFRGVRSVVSLGTRFACGFQGSVYISGAMAGPDSDFTSV